MARKRHVVLVPLRLGENKRRIWTWDVVRPYLAALDLPIHVGDSDGPWARAQAVNRAAEDAGKWDIAVVADADTVLDSGAVRRAISWVADTRGGARPHDWRWMLNKQASLKLAQQGPKTPGHGDLAKMWAGGGALVIHREAWEKVGGFDESYVGWGHEDSAMNISLVAHASYDRLPGEAWHIWHELGSKASPTSVKMYRDMIREHLPAIRAWGANKGIQNPEKVL
jgi:hypothetical protein